jgi:hypothetical protein
MRAKMKYLVTALLAVSVSSFAQSKIEAVQPALIPAAMTDYSTKKAIIIAREGTYVCPDGYDLYVNMPARKDDKKPQADPKGLYPTPPQARMISSEVQKYIGICIAIK